MSFVLFLNNFAAEGGHTIDDFSKKAVGKVKDSKIILKPKQKDFLGDYTYV